MKHAETKFYLSYVNRMIKTINFAVFNNFKKSILTLNQRFLNDYNKRIAIVGVPFDKGQPRIGVGLGPSAIRNGGLVNELKQISNSIDVKDYGDIDYKPVDLGGRGIVNMHMLEHVAGCTQELSTKVQEVLKDNRLCITLGGDHSISIGSIDGHVKVHKDICLLWVDAHTDLNTNATSPSGNIHGMPVALLTKELEDYWPYIPGMDWQRPGIHTANLAYIGLRSVDAYEKQMLEKFNITAFGMREVGLYGIKEVVAKALAKIDPEKKRSVHISFDIDGLDTLEAPSTGTSVRGGLSLREGIYIMEEVCRTGRVSVIDLVEVNPMIGSADDKKKTVDAAIHLLRAACGHNRIGNYNSQEDSEFKM